MCPVDTCPESTSMLMYYFMYSALPIATFQCMLAHMYSTLAEIKSILPLKVALLSHNLHYSPFFLAALVPPNPLSPP
jgi:hypothetical protein